MKSLESQPDTGQSAARCPVSWGQKTFRSLEDPNYRWYAIAQLISSVGSRIQITALRWLLFELTSSNLVLGTVSFLGQAPLVLLGLSGGNMADRLDRRTLLFCTRAIMLLQALALSILTFYGKLELWHVCILALTLGVANAVDQPAKQAFISNLVKRGNVVNAVSLNSAFFHIAKTIGPIVAVACVGAFGAAGGEASCFLLNALTFALVLLVLSKLEIPALGAQVRTRKLEKPKELLAYASSNRTLSWVLILGGASFFFCLQYVLLMPDIAKTVHNKSIDGYGILMSSCAIGSFVAALCLANLERDEEDLLKVITLSAFCFGLFLIGFALSTDFYLSCALIFCSGFCSTSQMSGSTSLIQLVVDDGHRGRMLGLWMVTKSALGALGGIAVGWLANVFGSPVVLAGCGLLSAGLALPFALKARKSDAASGAPVEKEPKPEFDFTPSASAVSIASATKTVEVVPLQLSLSSDSSSPEVVETRV